METANCTFFKSKLFLAIFKMPYLIRVTFSIYYNTFGLTEPQLKMVIN